MIIFTLDALADDSHRRHLIDHNANTDLIEGWTHLDFSCCWYNSKTNEKWQPDYPAYYEACDGDELISPVALQFRSLIYNMGHDEIQIWSALPESQRDKIYFWFDDQCVSINRIELKLRPISDDRPQEQLFELWKNDYLSEPCGYQRSIDMVFSSHKPTIDMFRAMGVFVFDCNQNL